MSIWVAFLRGVNVGGRHRLPMAALRAALAATGAHEPATYLQSGNAVFAHTGAREDLEAELAERLEAAFGFAVPVVCRSATELDGLVTRCPFTEDERAAAHVAFFARRPGSEALERLAARHSPERVVLEGNDAYLYLPSGVGRSKLAGAILRVAPGPTLRNFQTVGVLAAHAWQRHAR